MQLSNSNRPTTANSHCILHHPCVQRSVASWQNDLPSTLVYPR